MDFSLLYFANRTADDAPAEYDLLFDSARFADRNGFTAVWLPERHFHPFGGAYPNPALAAAALAAQTERIRLRAGSVVAPLHDPLTVVEDWAFVDNLSRGRVDLALATGWNAHDFVLAPERYAARRAHTLDSLAEVRDLWAGRTVERTDGKGRQARVTTYPRPVQPDLDLWLTCSSHPAGFEQAGDARTQCADRSALPARGGPGAADPRLPCRARAGLPRPGHRPCDADGAHLRR